MKLSVQVAGAEHEITVEPVAGEDGRWRVQAFGGARVVDARRVEGGWSLLIDGRVWPVDIDTGKDGDLLVDVRGLSLPVKLIDARRRLLAAAGARRAAPAAQAVRAPMPGKVVKLLCKAGDAITAGQALIVVEAMKMENELRAPRDGVVQAVTVKEGQPVEAQEILVTLA